MERVFKQRRAADRFSSKIRSKGAFVDVRPELVDPLAATKRGRAQRRWVVEYYGDPFGTKPFPLRGNPASVIPFKWTPAKVRVNAKGQVQVAIGRKHAAR